MKRMEDMVRDMIKYSQDNQNLQGHSVDMHGRQIPYDGGHSNAKMQQIGNVFYNLISMLGQQKGDTRMIGISNELRDMIQSRKFHNLFENNVPYAGLEKVNLLRTFDMSLSE